jgi:hypothetical protein
MPPNVGTSISTIIGVRISSVVVRVCKSTVVAGIRISSVVVAGVRISSVVIRVSVSSVVGIRVTVGCASAIIITSEQSAGTIIAAAGIVIGRRCYGSSYYAAGDDGPRNNRRDP